MGYVSTTLNNLLTIIRKNYGNLQEIKLLGLGDEIIWDVTKNYDVFIDYNFNGEPDLESFFKFIGFSYSSHDNNLKNKIVFENCHFDVITNLGGTSQINNDFCKKNQYEIFKYIHDIGKIGCIYYHVLPFTNNWKNNNCDYNFDFFKTLCEKCEYEIIIEPFLELYRMNDNEKLISIFYKKIKNNQFLSFEDFSNIPGLQIKS